MKQVFTDRRKRQAALYWLYLVALAALTVSLGVLRYFWMGEVSQAERERLLETLEQGMTQVGDAFNQSISAEVAQLLPERVEEDRSARMTAYAERFRQHRDTPRGHFFRSVGLAAVDGDTVTLWRLDSNGQQFQADSWPSNWSALRRQLESRTGDGRRMPPMMMGGRQPQDLPADVVEVPIFERRQEGRGGGDRSRMMRELEWLIVEVNASAVAEELIPALMKRYVGSTGSADYQLAVLAGRDGKRVLYGGLSGGVAPDASVKLFELRFDQLFRRNTEGRPRPFFGGEPRGPSRGRWTLVVRHSAGSLDALVNRVRWRNLGISFGILLLITAAGAALLRFSRRARQLADLQMEFMAGVSHELRTPLTVMRTAGHNLQGRISNDPPKVQRYGALIADESEKLKSIVDQILSYSNARAGRVLNSTEVLSVPDVLEAAMAEEAGAMAKSGCVVEKNIDPGLPMVLGDANTLRQAFRNLLSNAAKYASEGRWIGISAADVPSGGSNHSTVEIRIADRGPGIPPEDLEHIFDPFYRGRRAVDDQVHGTGLGLSLTRRIVEAHQGSVTVKSVPGAGTEFTVRIPSTGYYDDFANTAG